MDFRGWLKVFGDSLKIGADPSSFSRIFWEFQGSLMDFRGSLGF